MIAVLVHHDVDAEVERVAATGDRAFRTERGLDAAAATAAVLLPLHLHEPVLGANDVDHLRRLELVLPRLERTAARRADTIGFVELEDPLDDRKLRLLGRAERLTLLPRLLVLRACLRARLGLLTLREMIREVERALQLALPTFERIEPLALAFDHLQQLGDRSLLDARELSKLLDVLLALDVHARNMIKRGG